MLVDTNFAAAPIRRALQNAGFQVFTVGAREQDPLALAGDGYYKLDYADIAALEALTRTLGIDLIVPGCNDLSYAVCSTLAQRMNFPGLETPEKVAALHSKELFRDLCYSLSIPAPERYATVAAAVHSGKRVIVKPTDAYSGRGIEVVERPSANKLEGAIARSKKHSRTNTAILEEFVEGDLFSYSAFMHEGRVVCAFHVAEFGSVNPFVVDTSYMIPAPKMAPELKQITESISQQLGIGAGLMHLQYIATEDSFWIIEPTRRCPGDLYSRLIELSTGYPYAEAYVSTFLGGRPPRADRLTAHNIIRHTVTTNESGVLESFAINTDAAIIAWTPLATVGEELAPSPKGRVGVAFFAVNNAAERDALVQNLLAGKVFTLSYS